MNRCNHLSFVHFADVLQDGGFSLVSSPARRHAWHGFSTVHFSRNEGEIDCE